MPGQASAEAEVSCAVVKGGRARCRVGCRVPGRVLCQLTA